MTDEVQPEQPVQPVQPEPTQSTVTSVTADPEVTIYEDDLPEGGTYYTVMLDEEIIQPWYYRNLLNLLRNASVGDCFEFRINSLGGDWTSMLAITGAMDRSEAATIGTVDGETCSAAALIALACDVYQIPDDTFWLFHGASAGSSGHVNGQMLPLARAMGKIVDRVDRRLIKPILTEEEYSAMYHGLDVCLSGDEVKERLIANGMAERVLDY